MTVDHTRLAVLLRGAESTILDVGGKGAVLDRLVALQVPVPDTGALTTAAYHAFCRAPELAQLIDTLRTSPLPSPSDHERCREYVDARFLAAPMPPPVADAIAKLATEVGGTGRVAIRSSATAEDQAAASFAGQYRSFLDVAPGEVERAVRLTWASLWHPAPRAYRRYHGVDERDIAMAVLVMRMLDPEFAGVVFTRDPGGRPAAMRVELVRGLGEALVSGIATPEAFVVDDTDGGRRLGAVSHALEQLPAVARHLERALGGPQDLEWAVERGRLWILQARPITTHSERAREAGDGFDVHAAPTDELTTAGIAEMLPGVLPPRLWDVDSWLLEEGFRRLFVRLGGDVEGLARPHALLARYRGRVALDLDAMRAAVASIPGGSPAELEHQYFGSATIGEPAANGSAGLRQSVRTLRARTAAAQEAEIVVATVDRVLAGEPDLAPIGDGALLALDARVRHLGARAMAAEVAIAAMAAASYRGVEALLARHLAHDGGASATEIAQRITGRRGAGRSAIADAVRDLVDEVRADPELAARVASAGSPDVLGAHGAHGALRARYDGAIRRAGSMSVYGGRAWEEEPEQAWATVHAFVTRPVVVRLDEPSRRAARDRVEDELRHDRRSRATRALTGQLVDARRAFVRREADDAAELLARRERTKAAVLMLGGLQRRIDLEVATRLVARGALDDVADFEFVTAAESAALLGGTGPSLATIGLRRRRLAGAALDGPLPLRFRGDPPFAHQPVAGTAFRGWGASHGRYEGVARVVDSPSTAQLRRGEVLVARSTDASWAPLFLVAGAIVVEEGGPLSHAAIVARELGVPAVLNVPGLVERLEREPGEVALTVDGSSGEVTIHRQPAHAAHAAQGVVPVRSPVDPAGATAAGFNVFVTGLIGAGALFSLVVALTESVSSVSGRTRLRRRADPVAQTAAVAVLEGFEAAARSAVGLRRRRWYAIVAALLLLAAAAFGARATEAYRESADPADGAVVAWAAALSSVAALAVAGVAAARAASTWPRVPLAVRRLAPARSTGTTRAALGRRGSIVVAALAAAVAVLAVLVRVRFSPLDRLDAWIYDTLDWRGGAGRWAPDWMNNIGRPKFAVGLGVVMSLSALRCRVLASAIPTAIVGAGLTALTLTWLTDRTRPDLGGHAGEHNSFPSGHTAQLTLLFGLVPLVVFVVTHRRAVMHGVRALLLVALVIMLADTARTGGHWPSDLLAGVLLATAILVVVHARFRSPELHAGCHHCPYSSARGGAR
jgi:phosphohistidine swiveling domain-containing protein/membrane-associated phospholipid phosphatase